MLICFFFKTLPFQHINESNHDYILGFNGYRDFITTITNLFTLIIGIAAFGAYFSFKKFRAEKDEILTNLNDEIKLIVERRKMLDMLIKIQEAKIICDPEWGHLSAIKLYDRAESDYIDRDTSINKDYILYLLNVLKGDAFLLEWRRCKNVKEQKNIYLSEAMRNYNNALSKNGKSIAALYGLGLTIFNLATKSANMVNDHQCDWDTIIDFENTQNDDQNPNGEPKYIPVKIKQSSDYTSEKNEDVEKAIELMEKAELNGYDSTKIAFELGTMNEAINKNEEALLNYKKAYNENYLAAGYQYCYLWIRNKELNNHTDLKTLKKK